MAIIENVKSLFICPAKNRVVFGKLFLFAIVSCIVLIANPGFYSYDELERGDFILRYGFDSYLSHFVSVVPSEDFAFAVRPVAYLFQGLVSFFLPSYPFLVHLADVLMHIAVAFMLFIATVRIHGNRTFAWSGAIVFLVSPLAVFATGWSGALMDRLYILFGLAAFVAADNYIKRGGSWKALLALFIASTLAMLSKETALVLPFTLAVYFLYALEPLKSRRLWTAFLVWSIPPALSLLSRLPSISAPLGSTTESAYAPSLSNVPEGLLTYFLYPFLPFLTETHNWSLESPTLILFAIAAHLFLLLVLWLAFSFRSVVAYLFGYLIFLAPILSLPNTGAHYLYGAGIAFSLAIAAVITLKTSKQSKTYAIIAAGLLSVAALHTFTVQRYFYDTGHCMSKIMSTIESMYLTDGKPEKMTFLIEPNAPGHVLRRFTHAKENIGKHFPVKFEVFDWDKNQQGKTGYLFNCDCLVYKPYIANLEISDWGPQATTAGTVPNAQSDGSAGIWVKVASTKGIGEVEVLLSGVPAKSTSVETGLITAAFSPEAFKQTGQHELTIRQVSTGKIFPVGVFSVNPVE